MLGQSFTPAGLAAVADLAIDRDFAASSASTSRAPEGDPAVAQRGQYSFVQDSFARSRIRRWPSADRRARHLAAARFFELGEDELVGAPPYSSSTGPEADAVGAQARIAPRATANGRPPSALMSRL